MKNILFAISFFALVTVPLSVLAETAPGTLYPVYRLYNASLHDHLYTASSEEATSAEGLGYVLEGTLGNLSTRVLLVSQTPFYRLYDKAGGRHFYTDSNDELATLVADRGYVLEGTLGYLSDPSYPTNEGAVFRLYNPVTGDHLYTNSWVEWGMLQLAGWNNEGAMRGKLYSK